MKSKIFIPILSVLLCYSLVAQQNTYTSVPNIKDTFDYSVYTFQFNSNSFLQRQKRPVLNFISQIDNIGNPIKNYTVFPKLGGVKFANFSLQIGSKLFQLGAEVDTPTLRGNILILNSDMSILKDIVFYDYPIMEFNSCRYDIKRNKVIAQYSYSIHKDSFNVRQWGIMELDTFGNIIRKINITPIVRYEQADNLILTSDGGYLVSGKLNGVTTYIDPFFVKLDTNFNVQWRTDLRTTGEKFFTQDFSENLVELPNNKGYCYVGSLHQNIDTVTRKCWYNDHFTSLHFISNSGQVTRNYYHNITNKYCEGSRPKGLFLKNDSVLMIFTQRDTTTRRDRRNDSSSSLVIHFNFNQHKVTKEIIGGQLLNDKTAWVLTGFTGICFRKHVAKDIDGGFLTSGWADINDNNGTSAYLMKTDSCGYTQDHKCKLVYRIGKQVDKSLNLTIDDSLSVLCQPIWTIEGKRYTNPDIVHTFSSWGWHRVKLWGFAGSTTDSTEFDVFIDSTKTGIAPIVMNTISVYPNPASDFIEISPATVIPLATVIPAHAGISISMTNLLGQSLFPNFETSNRCYRLDTRPLPEGIYLLHIRNKNDNLVKTERIVIQRDQ